MLLRSLVSMPRLRGLLALCGLLVASVSAAAELAVTAQFSESVTGLGEPVQLQVKVTGARSAAQPPLVEVDGLRVNYLGPSQNTSMRIVNGRMESETSVTYIYQVEATRAGNFTVPALQLVVDGRTLRTQPVGLKVEQGEARSTSSDPARGVIEVILPKKTAYVGEMVPVDIRLSVDSRVHWQPEAMPEIPGEGFTKQKLPEPKQERGTRDGREMDVVVFRTAITPSKAGKITLGPIEIPYVAQVPRARRSQPRSFFDDIFGDPMFGVNQRYKARAEAVELEVKPLPSVGRPAHFSGAVGQFKFSASGTPERVALGNPVTIKLTVTGRGNFDRMEAPVMLDPAGWHSYPVPPEFKADNDLGTSGTKTFSLAAIPETKKTATPVFEFVYFDPTAEKYVTLTSEPEKLIVEGTVPPPPVVVPPAEEQKVAAKPPEPAPALDIFGLRYDAGGGRHSFAPIYARREFLLAQTVPLAGLLGMFLAKLRRRDANAKRTALWKRQKADLLAKMRGRELADQEFLETAAQVIRVDTALATGQAPESIDATSALASQPLDAETAAGVERIFSERAALLYAGTAGGGGHLSADERREVLATLETFARSHRRA